MSSVVSLVSLVRVFSLFLFTLAAACSATVTGPQPDALRLSATTSTSDVPPGGKAVVTFRLENRASTPAVIPFPNSCHVMPYVATRPSSTIVYPAGGGWTCAAILTELVVPANGAVTTELTLVKGQHGIGQAGLPAGEYAVFARMEARDRTIESAPVVVTLR